MKKTIYSNLPFVIKCTLLSSEGWLVGSSPEKILNGEIPKDYDIVVEDYETYMVTTAWLNLTADKCSVNTFGGLKFEVEGVEIDIWVEELGHFLGLATNFKYVYNLKRSKLITNTE